MKPGELPEAQTPPERPNAWSVADVGVELDKAVMLQHGFVLDVTTENAELKRDREAEAFRADFAETLVEARDAEIAKLQRELSEAQEARDAARRGSAEFRAQAERAKSIAQRLAAKVRELKNPTTS
jgi:diphthamide synthase (EF-2-diphthine--ammonia ligase)